LGLEQVLKDVYDPAVDPVIQEGVLLDEYYVRHWSIWLDFYILLRTLWAVVSKRGAY
jgi:lipopolysaccharide/colanic/teichoic acid biosynthesis glycosyltransferase